MDTLVGRTNIRQRCVVPPWTENQNHYQHPNTWSKRMRFNKQTGPRPSKEALHVASTLATKGSGDYFTVALALRPNGVTQAEVIQLLGRPHRNKIRQLVQDNKVQVKQLPEGSRSTRIKLIKR